MNKRLSKKAGSKRKRHQNRAAAKRPVNDAARLGAFLLTGSFAFAQVPVYAAGSLPIPCPGSGAACIGGTGKSLGFDQLGTHSTVATNPTGMVITQNANAAIFNWASFNITPGNTVQFIQPSSSSVALNRIFDPNVTTISGNLIANGQIYLINPNGILFGSGANVNVAGLIASTSNISDQRITAGLLYDPFVYHPVFTNDPTALGASYADSPVAGPNSTPSIVVQQGASLYAAGKDSTGTVVSAGRVFLFAPTVENGGSIKVDGGGQVILAAGSDVYLGSSKDPALRGLLVEVDGNTSAVTVDATGSITSAHGNITLMGLAVNQSGSLTATSALDANGSIRLIARETTPGSSPASDPDVLLQIAETGEVNIAPGSRTVVTLDPKDTATAPLNDPTAAALTSSIDIEGGAVNVGVGGAGATLVQAHGGSVDITARQAASQIANNGSYAVGDGSLLGASDLGNPTAGFINVGANATIDVSGLQDVPVNGARNFVYTELTSLNLANAPFQRSGLLLDKFVYLNLANVPSWINVSSLQSAVAGTQAERNSVGGTIALNAEGSVNLAKGSVLNVSGGSTTVAPATGRTTQLLTATGAVVDISNASATTPYVAFADGGSYSNVDSREGVNSTVSWQAPVYTTVGGYTQGSNAGTIQIYASAAALGGTLLGQTTPGTQQRGALPLGGQLRIGSQNAANLDSEAGIQRPNILLAGSAQALAQGLSSALQSSQTTGNAPTIALNTNGLQAGGFTRLDLTSDGAVELAPGTPLNLGPGGSLTIRANAIAIDSSITAPGGSVSLLQRPLTGLPGGDNSAADELRQVQALSLESIDSPAFGSLILAPGTALSTAGLWTNDSLLPASSVPTAPVVLNGGTGITLSATRVDVSGSTFDVSSGAWLKQSGQFVGGSGGSLSITALPPAPALVGAPASPQLLLGSDFASRIAGYGVTAGGSLTLGAWSLQIGPGAPIEPSTVIVDAAVAQSGFQSFQFNAFDAASVSAGTQFVPHVLSFQPSTSLALAPSNASLLAVDAPQAILPGTPEPTVIGIKANNPNGASVDVGTGALVAAGIEGNITLNGFSQVSDDGTLLAPAGSVALSLGNADPTNGSLTLAAFEARAIQLGPDATINVSGASLATNQANGLRTGNVLDAGSVSLGAPLGTVAVDSGARILAQGASDTVDVPMPGGQYVPQLVTSAGGRVSITANAGIFLDGQFNARGGGSGSNGGSLSVALQAVIPNLNDHDTGVLDFTSVATNLNIGANPNPLTSLQTTFAPYFQTGPSSMGGAPGTGATGYVPTAAVNGAGFENVWLQSADAITVTQSASLGSRAARPGAPYVLNSLVLSGQSLVAAPGVDIALTAGYVGLGPVAQLSAVSGGGLSNFQLTPPSGTAGTGSLQVNAQQIDLVGNLALQGIGTASLNSAGDVRGLGVQNPQIDPSRYSGALSFGGNLAINAAQLYPATQTDYSFNFAATGTSADTGNGQLTIGAGPLAGKVPLAPLSAGGSLSFNVTDFNSFGRVEAPLGAIGVNATSIVLQGGSVLSVAGSGVVPYGSVINNTIWTYGLPTSNNQPLAPYTLASATGTDLPAKGISLNSPTGSISANSGSVINIAGGGSELGTGFIAGPGGSYDLSLNFPFGNNTANPYFALIPSRGSAPAPFDPQTFYDLQLNSALSVAGTGTFTMGQTITIGAGSGIAAGTYTVMPARYALLPGAYAVEAVSGYAGISPGTPQTLADGTIVVAGKLGFADAGTGAALWSGYRVLNSAQFNNLAQFLEFNGNQFFATAASDASQVAQRLGQDAGALQVDGNSVLLASTIDAAPASTGRGAEIAIEAPTIVVGDFASGATQQTAPQTTLQLNASTLSGLGAETLILGAGDGNLLNPAAAGKGGTIQLTGLLPGLASPSAPAAISQSVSVVAQSTGLYAGEVILVGSDVSLSASSGVHGLGTQSPPTTAVTLSGDGAALFVGNTPAVPLWTRTGASAPGTATTGNLSIASGAVVAGNSVLFDATDTQTYGTGLGLQAANLDLSAANLNLGDVPASATGLNLSSTLLNTFSSARNLTISTVGGIDVYGAATLGQMTANGTPSLDRLTLIGPGIAGLGAGSGNLTIDAGHVSFDNSAGASLSNPGTGTGALTVNATATAIDDGSITIAGTVYLQGFGGIALNALGRTSGSGAAPGSTVAGTGDLLFTGSVAATPGLVLAGAATTLAIDATRITAQRGVDASILVPGALTIGASGPGAAAQQNELGASLSVTAQNITIGGRIDLPAGVVTIDATGAAPTDGITLTSGSLIRVAGVTQSFASTTADVSAGAIVLDSTSGSIAQNAGSTLDLGGSGKEGDAGSLALLAGSGTVALAGTVLATPGSQAAGANFRIDAASVASLSALAQSFIAATGSAGANSIEVRARSGDLDLLAGDVLKASTIVLEADGSAGATDGNIGVFGTLAASGSNGGTVALYANNQVLFGTGASVNARATGVNGNGGTVIVSSRIQANPAGTLDAIVFQSGSQIVVGGSGTGNGGTVLLRAPRVGNDVAITAAAGAVIGGTLTDATTTQTGINEKIIEAVQVYSAADNATIAANPNVVLDPSLPASGNNVLTTAQADAQAFMSAGTTGIDARLAALGSFSLRPGVEVDTTGTITVGLPAPAGTRSVPTNVGTPLDFAAVDSGGGYLWRYGGSTLATSTPGVLTLRAGGGIGIVDSITDGFAPTTIDGKTLNGTVASAGDSWSYTITAGADLSAANPARTGISGGQPGADLTIGTATASNPVAIRTGTGSISLNASEDVILANGTSQQGNVVYTAGVGNVVPVDGSGNALVFPALNPTVNNVPQSIPVVFTQYGGNLSINAGRDVLGTDGDLNPDGSTQNVNEWLIRGGLGTIAAPTAWFVDFAQFQQGFGVLGGGNLSVGAGRDITRVGAVVASNGYDSGSGVSQRNAGSLNVTAGESLQQGLYYDEAGSFRLSAANVVTNANSQFYSSVRLAQGSNDLVLQVRQSAEFDPSFNPTVVDPAIVNVGNARNSSNDAAASWQTQFLTFTDATTLDVRAAAGTITIDAFQSINSASMTTNDRNNFNVTAPNVQLVAFGGSVTASSPIYGAGVNDTQSSFILAPSATGQVRLLADGSVSDMTLLMSQSDPAALPQTSLPSSNADLTVTALKNYFIGNAGATLHAADTTQAEVVARTGSVAEIYLDIPKTTEIAAGNQVGGGSALPTIIELQNSNSDSLSSITAGHGMDFQASSSVEGIEIGGPGALQVISGGPINLGATGLGIVSRGNLDNSNLGPVGASLIVVAGTGQSASGLAVAPAYASAIDDFVTYDAFASTGSAAAALNQQVIAALATDPSLAPLVSALKVGLANRASAADPTSAFNQALARLTPTQLALGAIKLVSAIQVVNNQIFVGSNNGETFAPAYVAFNDLFPGLLDDQQAVRQFVLNDVFASAANGPALRAQALQGLPPALAQVIARGLADPGSVNQAGSGFSQALAALDPVVLQSGTRQLIANVLEVAGASEQALAASGSLTGSGSPYAKQLTTLAQAYAPSAPAGLNDIQMDYNEIKTEQTGSLAFLAPQGSVIVGQASPPSFTVSKTPSQLGIFTYGGGDIIGLARDSVDVYQSRVFTVAGGDIDLWSSLGNLDAGRGPRDVAVVPPPQLVVDANGVEQLDLSSTVSGSGIGALVTQPNQPASNINLMAPAGYVDAGEAGIRAQSGKVTLGTNLVLNAGNIQAASGVSGGAVVATPPPPLPPSTGSSAGDRVAQEAQREALAQQQQAAVAASQRPMRIVGEFIGFDDCTAAGKNASECASSDTSAGSRN
jgi:filamentous hemagglutinin family protein